MHEQVTVTGVDRTLAAFDGILFRARNPRPLLDDAADKIEQITAARFTDEGPGWAPLARSTQRDRRARGYNAAHPILQRTGALKASATAKGGGGGRNHIRRYAGARSIEVGSSLPYARFHQTGTGRMPARPVYAITRADAAVLRAAAVDYILGRWHAATALGASRAA